MIKLPKDIEYIITDFDGIMTDNYIYIPNNSDNYSMRLCFRDIMAVSMAIKNGYKVGIISGDIEYEAPAPEVATTPTPAPESILDLLSSMDGKHRLALVMAAAVLLVIAVLIVSALYRRRKNK